MDWINYLDGDLYEITLDVSVGNDGEKIRIIVSPGVFEDWLMADGEYECISTAIKSRFMHIRGQGDLYNYSVKSPKKLFNEEIERVKREGKNR